MGYSKTFAFLIVALLGWLNVSYLATEDEVSLVIDNVLQVVGLVGAFWARYKQGDVTVLGFRK